MSRCLAETCSYWTGDGCICDVLNLKPVDLSSDPLCQCQGCGAWAGVRRLGEAHACWRNEDGTYEEGGTFQ